LTGDCRGSSPVIGVLEAPRALIADSSRLYSVVALGQAKSALVKFSKDVGDQNASAAEQVTNLENGRTLLAPDDLGIVVANADTQTILRVDRSTGDQTPLRSSVKDLNGLAADANGVYWATEAGAFWLPR
jgi:hypothetical protein